jgi:hypothetical protein
MNRFKLPAFCALIAAVLALSSCPNVSSPNFSGQDNVMLYSITATPTPVNGQIKFSEDSAPVNTYIKVYILPDPGYVLQKLSYYCRGKQDAKEEPVGGNTDNYYRQFALQAYNTEVIAEFALKTDASKYTVSVERGIKNGFIVPDVQTATLGTSGTVVKLWDFPSEGYVLDKSTIVVKDAETGQPAGVPITNDSPPYTFILPAKNVIVSCEFKTAEFAGYLENAQKYIASGQYDTAASYYAQAYKKSSGAPAESLNEVIFYHSIGKLGSILIDRKARELLGTGKGHLQFKKVPASIDDWVCDSDSGWIGVEDDRWYTTYRGINYGAADQYNEKRYMVDYDDLIKWKPSTEITEDIVLPRLEDRVGIDRENSDDNRNGSFAGSFADMKINSGNINSRQAFFNRLFWVLLVQNRDDGFNTFLQNLEERFFGSAFEDAAKIAATLPDNAQVTLYPNLVRRFGLEKYYGTGEVKVGKAELDYIFGMLRLVKGSIQYMRAYDWTIDLRPWLVDEIDVGDGLAQIMGSAFKLVNERKVYKDYWDSSSSRAKILPFRGRFLEVRTSGNFSLSKDEFTKAINMVNSAMNVWHGSSGNFSAEAKTKYNWAKTAFEQAKNAMTGSNNGNFGFPKKLPGPGESWPDYNSADYAVNLPVFFKAGSFSLKNLFKTETSGAPLMYIIPWYYGNDYSDIQLLPQQAIRISSIIPNDESSIYTGISIPSGKNPPQFGLYSFQMNTGYLRTIFPRGFEQAKYSTTGDNAYFYEVFPTIPLWPERPTYLIGPGDGNNKGAQYLYSYYRDIKITDNQL